MATGDTFRVTINSTGQGSIYQTTHAVKLKTSALPDTVMFGNFVTDWLALVKPITGSTTTWTDWSAVQLWGTGMSVVRDKCVRTGGLSFNATLSGQIGGVVGEALPPQASLVTTLTTGLTGRRHRGRVYLGGILELNQAEGLWTSSFVTNVTTAWNTFSAKYFKDTGTSSDLKLVIWSERTASGCIPATPPAKGHVNVDTPSPETAASDVTGFLVRNIVYSQRRRTRGVGR